MKRLILVVLVFVATAHAQNTPTSTGHGVPTFNCAVNDTYGDIDSGLIWQCGPSVNTWHPLPQSVPWQTPTNGQCLIGNGHSFVTGACGGSGSMTWPASIGLANYVGANAWGLSLPVPPYTVPSTATGVTYYVDSVNGLDSNNGTSTATPWKTIAKVNASTFNPGDQVLFLRGDVWQEQLTVPSSGSSTAQLTFGNYGPSTADLPVIDPALPVTTWSLQSATTYQHATTITVYTVYVDSLYQPTKSLAHVASLALVNSTPGSFFSNGSELYVNLADGSNPVNHTVEIGYLNGRAYGVLMTDKDYVTITGLKIVRAYVAGIEGNSVTSNQGGTYYNAYNIVTGNTIFNYGNYLHTTGGNTGASAAIGVGGDNLAGENPIPGWQITYNNIGVSDYTQALDYTTAGIQLKNLTGVLVDHNTIATVNSMAIQSRLGTTNTSTGPGTISNNDISNSQGGISAEDSAFTVQANKIHDSYGFGIQATTGSLILNNDIHNLSQSASGSLYNGIDENAMTGVTIAGNKITNIINGCSLDLENGSTGAQVFGNLFDGFGDGCILYIPSTSVTGLALGSNTYVEAPAISTLGFHYGGGAGTQHSRAAFWSLAPEGGGDVSNAFNLQGFAVPTPASGYLHYNGTAYVWDSPSGSGTGATTSAVQMPHWIACTAKVKINAGNCRVYMVGDSTTWGTYSQNTSNTGDPTTASYPTRLAQYLNSSLLPTQRDSFMGDGGYPSNLSVSKSGAADARVTLGSFAPTGIFSTGGAVFAASSGSSPLAFLPTDNVDTFRVWYINTGGVFSYNVDGGSSTNVTGTGTLLIQSVVVPAGSVGSHTLNLTWISTGSVWIVGVEAYNSTVGSVQIINAGWPSSLTSDWNASAQYHPITTVTAQAPDVIVIDLGINDWNASVSVATYTANLQALITAWEVNSDVVLVSPAPSSIAGGISLATQETYVAAMQSLATTNNIPFIDNFNRWISYELKNPAPYLFYNQALHPGPNGYSDFAQSVASQLLSITGK